MFVFLSYRKSFLGLKNEFESAMVNEPSVFESLKILLYVLLAKIRICWPF